MHLLKETPPHDLDVGLRNKLQQAADACGTSWRELPSGAGHDSQTMGTRVATAMLFVPSIDGRSHSPAEYSTGRLRPRGICLGHCFTRPCLGPAPDGGTMTPEASIAAVGREVKVALLACDPAWPKLVCGPDAVDRVRVGTGLRTGYFIFLQMERTHGVSCRLN